MVRVSGKYSRPTGETGKLVPRFAYEKEVDDKFKVVFPVEYKYDISRLKWAIKNGVIRVRIGLTDAALGQAVEAVDNVEVGGEDGTEE